MSEKRFGPTILGLAACNDPHITGMDRLKVIDVGDKKLVKAQAMRFGKFRHPRAPGGIIESNQALYDSFFKNFRNGAVGRSLFWDPAHKVDEGSLGEFVELTQEGDKMFILIDPTPEGLKAVEDGKWNYASLHFHPNWRPNEVLMRATELDEITDIQLLNDEETENMGDKDKNRQDPEAEEPTEGEAEDVELTDTPERDPVDESDAGEAEDSDVSLSETELEDERIIKLRAQYESMVKSVKKQSDALANELELARAERVRRESESWQEHVELFLETLAKPDKDGGAVGKQVIELSRQILLGEDIDLGNSGEIKLSSAKTEVDRRDYYRRAVMALLRVIPRPVPAGESGIEKRDISFGRHQGEEPDIKLRYETLVDTSMDAHGMNRAQAEAHARKILGVTEEDLNA